MEVGRSQPSVSDGVSKGCFEDFGPPFFLYSAIYFLFPSICFDMVHKVAPNPRGSRGQIRRQSQRCVSPADLGSTAEQRLSCRCSERALLFPGRPLRHRERSCDHALLKLPGATPDAVQANRDSIWKTSGLVGFWVSDFFFCFLLRRHRTFCEPTWSESSVWHLELEIRPNSLFTRGRSHAVGGG